MKYTNYSDEELLKEKNRLESVISTKNAIQSGIKVIMNALYGACGTKYFNFFDIRIASAITLSGQWSIITAYNAIMNNKKRKKYKWEVCYIDTDSVYIDLNYCMTRIFNKKQLTNDQEKADYFDSFCKRIIEPIIDEGYEKLAKDCNTDNNVMKMKRECLALNGFWIAKKKYALMIIDNEGVRYPLPKLKVKGIEIVRSSTPKVCRDNLKKAVELILTDEDKLISFINDFKEEFKTFTPEQIAFPRGCNNLQKNYDKDRLYKKGCPIHVRASLLYNKFIEDNELEDRFKMIEEGSKMKFIHMRTPNPIYENVFGFVNKWPSEKLQKYIDYDTQYYKSFLSVIENICEKIGIELEQKNVNMDDLF